jgi:hypothetical protein
MDASSCVNVKSCYLLLLRPPVHYPPKYGEGMSNDTRQTGQSDEGRSGVAKFWAAGSGHGAPPVPGGNDNPAGRGGSRRSAY